ncbi:universal stress protein [Enterococcus sp. BWB1-3]|uniref:universal stress protein n=1 Tax=unclassified Enterococcus TaxID=2608891 RepID=UPI0019205AF8|nr:MULTISPECIES: universal stress protein [unclassified Enterococcus]MBL1229814.1 universal stress protein [Enterococcus sp. BWB1-3]MCB5952436.1 universal stress protein [Enterococcus sp. BWT-B8]MCB5955388.1 universal stress protein [Enterococcus sp. CWB-B31]
MLKNYERILVAVDGSKNSELALKHAVEIAAQNGAALYVLAIIDKNAISHSSFAFSKVLEEEKELVESEMAKHLAYASEHNLFDVTPIVEIGNPKHYIATTVPTEEKIDLIVIGATGKGRLTETTVGSTTNYVVQNAPCTVLVVKE